MSATGQGAAVSGRIVGMVGLLALAAGPALAWEKMAASELAGHGVTYDGAHQSFASDGTTIYTAQNPSAGQWRDEGGRYCSVWPPADSWACYRLERERAKLRFVAEDGAVTEGTLD